MTEIRDIYMVSGWTKHGKDTLFHQFNDHSCKSWNWSVYKHPNIKEHLFVEDVKHVAFAKILKDEVRNELDLPIDTDVEKIKDEIIKDGKTFRSFLIEKAAQMRDIDPDHWCKKAFDGKTIDESIMITDWRYPNEFEYIKKLGKVCTIRVFRSCASIPSSDDKSEHQLDNFEPDYLLILKENKTEELKKLVQILPQFGKYEKSRALFFN